MSRLLFACKTSVVCAALSAPTLLSPVIALAGENDGPRSILHHGAAPAILPDDHDAEPADPSAEFDYEAGASGVAGDSDDFYDDLGVGGAPSAGETGGQVEVFTERYPDGKIKVSREVIKDGNKNYVNHCLWRMWAPDGSVMVEGQYQMGARHGVWKRRFKDGALFSELPYNLFTAPFVSTVTLDRDKLHGKWIIQDAEGRKISEWSYSDDRRHGEWSWWFPDGRKMQQMTYREGALDGKLVQWGADGEIKKSESYENGRKQDRKVAFHPNSRQKRSEVNYLLAPQVVTERDDWANAKPAKFTKSGEDQKHGRATFWNANGQIEVQGEYRRGEPVGAFTWWHPNGQKAVKGQYDEGQQQGEWTWWHENGMKAIEGGFASGAPTGEWAAWRPDGKLAREYTVSEGQPGGESLTTTPIDDRAAPAPPAPYGASRPLPRKR